MKLKASSGETHPEGWYPMCVKSYEQKDGNYGPQIVWRLESKEKDEAGDRITVTHYTPCKITVKNGLGMFLNACGLEFEPGDDIDLDDLVGGVLECLIEDKETASGVYSKVAKVRARRVAAKSKGPSSSDKEDPFSEE